jgi:hypothetical protein
VCLLRDAGDRAEYLLLGDSPLLFDDAVLVDDRFGAAVADLRAEIMASPATIGTPAHAAHVRALVTRQRARTNRADGYWIAAANPDAAAYAVTGARPLRGPGAVDRAALMSDGAYEPLARGGRGPRELLDLVAADGPAALLRRVHDGPRDRRGYKAYDDASIVDCRFGTPG